MSLELGEIVQWPSLEALLDDPELVRDVDVGEDLCDQSLPRECLEIIERLQLTHSDGSNTDDDLYGIAVD